MKNRTARCQCGGLKVEAQGEPEHVFMCSCEDCQRRTGSSFHVGGWFLEDRTRVDGASRQYTKTADSGNPVEFYFCPTCGTTVHFAVPALLPGMRGIAAGCFVDPDFPAPETSVFGKRRHRWVSVPEGVPAFAGWTDGELE